MQRPSGETAMLPVVPEKYVFGLPGSFTVFPSGSRESSPADGFDDLKNRMAGPPVDRPSGYPELQILSTP